MTPGDADFQPLIAAFAFGIVANAASAAFLVFLRGPGPPIFQDSLRLVLVIFLSASALWTIVSFVGMNTYAAPGCQVAVAFASAFDQLARTAFEQFLLWKTCGGIRISLGALFPQLGVILRFVLGGVFVGFQRSHFYPVCISSTVVLPLGIAVLVADALLITLLLTKIIFTRNPEGDSVNQKESRRSKALLLAVAGAGFWTAISAPMILGIKSLHLSLRTALPSIGLLLLIIIVVLSKDGLLIAESTDSKLSPEAPIPREYRTADIGHNGRHESACTPFAQRPPTQYADVKRGGTTAWISAMMRPDRNKKLPSIRQPEPGQSETGIGGLPVTGQLFPPMRPEMSNQARATGGLQILPSRQIKRAQKDASIPFISEPILGYDGLNPLDKIPTVDLETAARKERERREMNPQPTESQSVGIRGLQPVILSPGQMVQRSRSISGSDRKAVGQGQVGPNTTKTHLEPIVESGSSAATSSAQLSPGAGDVRQRSPRQPQKPFSRQTPPPLPPLKTPGTMNNDSTVSTTKNQSAPDAWDLLSVPETNTDAPTTPPPRSPSRSHHSTSPATESIGTMSEFSRPDSLCRHKRSASISSKSSRAADVMFTDPRAPPPIPERCLQGNNAQRQTVGTESPPPYKTNSTNSPSPSRAVTNLTVQPNLSSIVSPSKPEGRLSVFPPTYSSKGSIRSPQRGPSTMPPRQFRPAEIEQAEIVPPQLPESKGADVSPEDQAIPRSQTVMLVEDIQYQNAIRTQHVPIHMDKPLPKSPSLPTMVRESVVNRPRPIPRTPEAAHLLHAHGGLQRRHTHRRSMSTGSIPPKKFMLHNTTPGSPSRLPPLPPTPASDGLGVRPQPNDTKSMTFEEKMEMFYRDSSSTGSSASKGTRRRLISVPPTPRLPETQNVDDSIVCKPSLGEEDDIRTERSTMTSVRTQSILDLCDPSDKPRKSRGAPMSNFSTARSRDGPRASTELLASSPLENRVSSQQTDEKTLPLKADPQDPAAFEEDAAQNDDSTSSTASIHSPAKAVNMRHAQSVKASRPFEVHLSTRQASDDDAEKKSTGIGLERSQTVDIAHSSSQNSEWNRRIGEECSTFTNRRIPSRRRAPPPPPLLLSKAKTTVVGAEPSPIESPDPEHALKMVQEQLQKLERSSQISSVNAEQRMTLLADLEKEMGLQENHWQTIRHTIVDDSHSTVSVSPVRTRESLGQQVSLWSNVAAESRGSKLLAQSSRLNDSSESLGPPDKIKDDRANRSNLSRLSNAGNRMSLLTVSQTAAQLGSPTPPDTDESEKGDEAEIPLVYEEAIGAVQSPAHLLWSLKTPSPTIAKVEPSLWSPGMKSCTGLSVPISTRPAARSLTARAMEPPEIESSQLWSLDNRPAKAKSSGLWEATSLTVQETPQTAKQKPLAQKPVRKSKRITGLPDILESPEPLPGKGGALGIFQFPWGVKSDMATVPTPIASLGAMPGTMASGSSMINPALGNGSPGFGEPGRHQPSFFDDSNEEDAGDNFADLDGNVDDDDVDETTLWEIASLLQPKNNSPDRSLLPAQWRSSGQRTSVVASPTDSIDSPQRASIPLILDVKPRETSKARPPLLWENKPNAFHATKNNGLAQPDQKTWKSYVQGAPEKVRAVKRRADVLSITSTEMWTAPRCPLEITSHSLLWSPDEQHTFQEKPDPETSIPGWGSDIETNKEDKLQLWTAPAPTNPQMSEGMWQPRPRSVPQSPRVSSPLLPPSSERKRPIINCGMETMPDFSSQTMWNPGEAASQLDAKRTDWLRRSLRKRTFDGDVAIVQRLLYRRWGGF